MKKCIKCREEKEGIDFPKSRITCNICKKCRNTTSRKLRNQRLIECASKEKQSDKSKFSTFYVTPKGRATHMLNNARSRAATKNLEMTLDQEWIMSKLKQGVCEVTGLPLTLRINGGKGHINNSFSPSLDRIDNNAGYTKDNVQVVCWIYNRAKGAFPVEDLLLMASALEAKLAQQTQ